MLGGDLAKNFTLICSAKALRTLGFGLASVVLGLYLLERGFSKTEVGVLLSATLIQDAVLTTAFSALASTYNNRHILFLSCALMFFGALLIAFSQDKWILAIAVVCGIISPAGFEGGPFAAIEQSLLSRAQRTEELTKSLSVYNMVGFGGAALGALLAGSLVAAFSSFSKLEAYQFVLVAYALCTPVILLLYGMLKIAPLESAEKMKEPDPRSVNSSSNDSNYRKSWIWQLAGLQSLDAFGGGFVVQSMLTLWFYQQYQLDAAFLGSLFFWCNIIAALSFTLAPWITRRIGLLRTMVFTHLPCSLTLCLLPFLPSKEWAAALLVARSFFSSMDIPVRQAYAMLLVPARDRAFASGLTSSSRAVAQSISPSLSGFLMQHFFLASPLICAGLAKSVYDILLYVSFRNIPLEGSGHREQSEPSATSQTSSEPSASSETNPELLASTGNRT